MAASPRVFEVLPDEDETAAPSLAQPVTSPGTVATHGLAAQAIALALRALGQRALVALADLFTLISVLAAFWLWISIPDPNDKQLIAMGMYAVFTLAINVIVRRSK